MPDATTLQAMSITATVVLAFLGYIITYLNNLRLENRKAQIKFISDQVQNLYGPLFSLSHASREAWVSFRSRCRPVGAFFDNQSPPNDQELDEWRLWMSNVFMPINLKMEQVIVENAHLIEGVAIPTPFLQLLAHVEVYRAVIKKWERNDFTQHTSYLNFPEGFEPYVSHTFESLKRRQFHLFGKQLHLPAWGSNHRAIEASK
jgi:hypothetical protein